MKDLMQLVDDYACAYEVGVRERVKEARQRVADYIESIGAGGVQSFATDDIAANMVTAAAQGFRDGANADTERLRFMFDCVVAGRDPYPDAVAQRIEKEYPSQENIRTFEDFRRVVDICRGAA